MSAEALGAALGCPLGGITQGKPFPGEGSELPSRAQSLGYQERDLRSLCA